MGKSAYKKSIEKANEQITKSQETIEMAKEAIAKAGGARADGIVQVDNVVFVPEAMWKNKSLYQGK